MTLHRDEKRGHFALDLPLLIDRPDMHEKSRLFIGCDMGSVLNLSHRGAPDLTPDEARELASALTWWADRARRDEPADDEWANDINDLFDLLEETP